MTVTSVLSFGFATLETVTMGVIGLVAARRWPVLDRGARWIAVGVLVYFGFALVMMPMVLLHRGTRLVQEVLLLAAPTIELVGFAWWQPDPGRRRVVLASIPVYVLCWTLAQLLQGRAVDFSAISGPIQGSILTAAAGFTMIGRVQAAMERWTDRAWFWVSAGTMLVFGTQVLLDPIASLLYPYRPDLSLAVQIFHNGMSAAGNLLILVGIAKEGARRSIGATDSSSAPVGGELWLARGR